MPGSVGEGALAGVITLPGLWPHRPLLPRAAGRAPVQPLQAAGVVDQRHVVRIDPTAAAHMVPGDLPDDPSQERHLGAGPAPATGRVVQHGLAA